MTTPEDLYREKFSGYSPEPPQELWNGIDRRLSWRRFFTFNPRTINIYYAAAALGAAAYLGYQLPDKHSDIPGIAAPMEVADVYEPINPVAGHTPTHATPLSGTITPIREFHDETSTRAEADSDNHAHSGPTASTSQSGIIAEHQPDDSANSTADRQEPIRENSNTRESLSDPKKNKDIKVRWGSQGFAAALEAETENGDLSYLWDLGDGGKAVGKKVSHRYAKPGDYRVRLVAFSAAGNFSDTVYQDITIKGTTYSITFPNALVATTSAAAFAPKGNIQELTKYRLTVYNRNGMEVFSTTDPLQGWHGYYHGDRVPKGVYAYRAACQFLNGEQTSYSGSITIFWEENNNLIIHP